MTTADDSHTAAPRRRRLLVPVALLTVVLLAAGAYVMWGVPPAVPRNPMHAERDASGQVVLSGTPDEHSTGGKAAALESRTSFSAARSTSFSDNSVVLASSAAVFNFSDHLLMQRLGDALFRSLAEGRLKSVDYYPLGHRPDDGRRLPDLLFTLDLVSLEETGIAPRRNIDVKIAVTAGRALRSSNNHYQGHYTPPVLEFHWRGEAHLDGTLTGIETSAERYSTVANDLSQSIAKQVESLLQDIEKDYGHATKLPDDFYPAYEPPPDFAFLKAWKAEKLLDGSAMWSPTDVTWRIHTEQPAAALLASAVDELESQAGWNLPKPEDRDALTELMAQRRHGFESLAIFPERKGLGDSSETKTVGRAAYIVRYVRVTNDEQRRQLTNALLDSDAGESELLLLSRHWTPEQRERVFERFKKPRSPRMWRELARDHRRAGRLDEAREAVRNGVTLHFLQSTKSDSPTLFKDLAKQLEMEAELKQPDPERALQLGVINFRQPGEATATAREGEPVILLVPLADRPHRFIVLTPKSTDSRSAFAVQILAWSERGVETRTWYDSPLPTSHEPGEPLKVRIENLIVTVTPKSSDGVFPAELTIVRAESPVD